MEKSERIFEQIKKVREKGFERKEGERRKIQVKAEQVLRKARRMRKIL